MCYHGDFCNLLIQINPNFSKVLLFSFITLFVIGIGSSPWIKVHLSFSQTFFSVGLQVGVLTVLANRDVGMEPNPTAAKKAALWIQSDPELFALAESDPDMDLEPKQNGMTEVLTDTV